jgi:hypothetical protein
MFDAWMALDLLRQRINIPRLSIGLSIVLAAKVENFVLQSLITVPAVSRKNTAILEDLSRPALVDAYERDIVWSIA